MMGVLDRQGKAAVREMVHVALSAVLGRTGASRSSQKAILAVVIFSVSRHLTLS